MSDESGDERPPDHDSDVDDGEEEDTFDTGDVDEPDSDFDEDTSGGAAAGAGAGSGSGGSPQKSSRRASVMQFMKKISGKGKMGKPRSGSSGDALITGLYDGHAGGGEEFLRTELTDNEGLLKKPAKGSSMFKRGWQSRYVRLEGRVLSYYAKSTDAASGASPRDATVITTSATVEPLEDPKHPFAFVVHPNKTTTWQFQASSEEDRDHWIEALEQRIHIDPADHVAKEAESQHAPKIGRARQLTDLIIDRAHGEGGDWKSKLSNCESCGIKFGLQSNGHNFKRMRCKHCGRSVCLRCCPDTSKRMLPKFGFTKPVRCCLACTELLDHMEITVQKTEEAFEDNAFEEICKHVGDGLVSPDYESGSHSTALILAVEQRSELAIEAALDAGANIDYVTEGPSTALITAVEMSASDGKTDTVELLLAKGADIMTQTRDGDSAFLKACAQASRNDAALQLFLKQDGIDVDEPHGMYQASPLMWCLERGFKDAADTLLAAGAKPAGVDAQGNTPLHYAARGNQGELVKQLCDIPPPEGADAPRVNVNTTNAAGETALVAATRAVAASAVAALLDKGADVTVRPVAGRAARGLADDALAAAESSVSELEASGEDEDALAAARDVVAAAQEVVTTLGKMDDAITRGDFAAAFALLDNKNFPVDYQSRAGLTLLMAAGAAGDMAALNELLTKRGATVDRASSADGVPALFHSVRAGKYDAAKALIDAGASMDVQDADGHTVLMAAAMSGAPGTCQLIVSAGADVNAKDRTQMSSLHHAASGGHYGAATVLLGAGAEVNTDDDTGRAPLAIAAAEGHLDLVRLLHAHKARVNAKAGDDSTALHAAASRGHAAVVTLLLELGANAELVESLQDCTAEQLVERAIAHLEDAAAAEGADDASEGSDGGSDSGSDAGAGAAAATAGADGADGAAASAGAGDKAFSEGAETELANLQATLAALRAPATAMQLEKPEFGPVFAAIDRGNWSVNHETSDGVMPLLRAAEVGDTEAINQLVARGADPNLPSRATLVVPLQAAVQRNNAAAVSALCHAGAWVNLPLSSRGQAGKPVVVLACEPPSLPDGATDEFVAEAATQRAECLRVLLRHNANADWCNAQGESLLQLACVRGQIEVVEALVAAHADVAHEDSHGTFPLLNAAYCPREHVQAVVSALLDAGADVNQVSSNDGASVIMAASEAGPPALAQVLVDRGADLLWERDDGKTARQLAEERMDAAAAEAGDDGGDDGGSDDDAEGKGGDKADGSDDEAAGKGDGDDKGDTKDGDADAGADAKDGDADAAAAGDAEGEGKGAEGAADPALDAERADAVAVFKIITAPDRAIEEGDAAAMLKFLRMMNVTADYENDDGVTALISASIKGDLATMEAVLNLGASVNHVSSMTSKTALQGALEADQKEAVALLLRQGAHRGVVDEEHGTALLRAAANGWLTVVELLCEGPAGRMEVNVDREDGTTAIIAAAQNGHAEVVRALLGAGALVDVRRGDGEKALSLAESNGHADVVKLLTAHDEAASAGDFATVLRNIDAGNYSVDHANKDGKTCMMLAAEMGNAAAIDDLISHRAGINLVNRREKSDEAGEDEGAEAEGAPPLSPGLHGFTALMYACRAGNADAALRVLRAGADVDPTDAHGRSALYYAARSGMVDVVEGLLRADASIATKVRCSPLTAACRAPSNRIRVVEIILREGLTRKVFDPAAVLESLAAAGKGGADAPADAAPIAPDVVAFCNALDTAIEGSKFDDVVKLSTGPLAALFPIDHQHASGHTALSKAAADGNAKAIFALLDAGANINYRSRAPPRARSGSSESAAARDAAATAEEDDGPIKDDDLPRLRRTALMVACAANNAEAAIALLGDGARVRMKDARGADAFKIAVEGGCVEVVAALADAGVPFRTARFVAGPAVDAAAAAEAKERAEVRRAEREAEAAVAAAESAAAAAAAAGAAGAAGAAAAADGDGGGDADGETKDDDAADDADAAAKDDGGADADAAEDEGADAPPAQVLVTGVELALLRGKYEVARALLDRGARLFPLTAGVKGALHDAEGDSAASPEVKAILEDGRYTSVHCDKLAEVLSALVAALSTTPADGWDHDIKHRPDVPALVHALKAVEAGADYTGASTHRAAEVTAQDKVVADSRAKLLEIFRKHEVAGDFGGLDEAALAAAAAEAGGEAPKFAAAATEGSGSGSGEPRVRFHEFYAALGAQPRSLFSPRYDVVHDFWVGAGASTDRRNGRHSWLQRLETASTPSHVCGLLRHLGEVLFTLTPKFAGDDRDASKAAGGDCGAARDADEAAFAAWTASLAAAEEQANAAVGDEHRATHSRIAFGVKMARNSEEKERVDQRRRGHERARARRLRRRADIDKRASRSTWAAAALDEWNRRELSKQWFGVMDDLANTAAGKRAQLVADVAAEEAAAIEADVEELALIEQGRLKGIRDLHGSLRRLYPNRWEKAIEAANASDKATGNDDGSAVGSAAGAAGGALEGTNAGAGAGELAVGRRISVRWTKGSEFVWYDGLVIQYMPDDNMHEVLYDDGSAAVYNLAERTHRLMGEADEAGGGAAAAGGGDASDATRSVGSDAGPRTLAAVEYALDEAAGGDGGSDWGGESDYESEESEPEVDDAAQDGDGAGEVDGSEDGGEAGDDGGDGDGGDASEEDAAASQGSREDAGESGDAAGDGDGDGDGDGEGGGDGDKGGDADADGGGDDAAASGAGGGGDDLKPAGDEGGSSGGLTSLIGGPKKKDKNAPSAGAAITEF